MQFLTVELLSALVGAILLYWSVPKREWQNLILLGTSLAFLGYLSRMSLALLVVSTGVEWMLSRRMGSATLRSRRLVWLWVSVALNVAQLAVFKYSQFFLPEMTNVLQAFGFKTDTLRIIMPVGLSFWTLQKMTLTLDVYYRRRPPERNFFRALLFTGFFPTLLSGPIEYSRNLLPQFDALRKWESRRFSEGIWLLVMGAFLKEVIADNVGDCADALLVPGNSGISIVLGIWAYALQIYGDFAGYSYMARGCARLFGIDVTQNFLAPYLSQNLSDYWKHWHISLSGWLNDFVFAPTSLTLRRFGTGSIVLGIWTTFLVSGLWHGTGLTYVVWGCVHASGLTLYTLTKKMRKRIKEALGGRWLKGAAIFITFNWVCLGYIFFRSANLAEAVGQLHSIFRFSGAFSGPSFSWSILIFSALAVFWLQGKVLSGRNVFWIFEKPIGYRVVFYLIIGFLLFRFYAPYERFIYFQF